MTDDQSPALEVGDEVVQTEVENTEAPEAVESTEGQEQNPPAEEKAEEAEAEEQKSPSKIRRERRKAHMEALKASEAEAKKQLQAITERQAAQAKAAQETQPPKEADFADFEEYQAARTAWYAGQEFDKRAVGEIQRQADEQERQVKSIQEQSEVAARENWEAQRTEAVARYKDFDAVVSAPDLKITKDMAAFLSASDLGADVAYYLGTNKAEAAQKAGRFDDEIAPVTINTRKGDVVVGKDEYIRHGATLDAVSGMRAAFDKDGSVTAANASGINDGAAALVLMGAKEADKRGLTPMARIASRATAGVDPAIMGTGPIPASRRALERAGWKAHDLDLIEANEAFAAQACAVNQEMGWDTDKVNVNGGAIAIGHPIGASGARVLVTLLHEMQRRDAKKGLATLCIGGGMGVAMCVER